MAPKKLLSSCFRTFQTSHLQAVAVGPPTSPSSILPCDEHHTESKKMLKVTSNWILKDDFLLPTKPHLHDYCRKVATLMYGDRLVCFICTSPESVGSCSVSVHLSRIQTQGGKLLQFTFPYVSSSTAKLVSVEVQESALGMLAISDYLYRSHIDFSSLDVSDTIEIAATAGRWECHDLFVGSLLHIVWKKRFDGPFSFPSTVSLRWLSQVPAIFMDYLCSRSATVLPRLKLPQLIDVIYSAYLTSTRRLYHQVLHYIMSNDKVRTSHDIRLMLTFYRSIPIPFAFKDYFASKTAKHFFELSPPDGAIDKERFYEYHDDPKELGYMDSSPSEFLSKGRVIDILDGNMILFETLQRIDESSKGYNTRDFFWTIIRYAEPLICDQGKTIALLQRIGAGILDHENIFSDENNWKHISARGVRIATLFLGNRPRYCPGLQLYVAIPWDSLRTGSSVNAVVGSVAGIKFELKPRSTLKHGCSWRLYYSNVEGCRDLVVGSYTRISYKLENSRCCCEDTQSLERIRTIRLGEKNLRNGSVRALHTEGELTVLKEQQAEKWCIRHQQTCTLGIFVKVELQ